VIAGIVEQSAKTERNELFMTFGALLKELRIVKELTLRQCSADLDVDPSNWSKIERNITPAPKDLAVLERWAAFFALSGDKKSRPRGIGPQGNPR
jgi:transcriptional regulator with XRE-family HTH domain